MKISLNWIKEYTPIKLSPNELKERISVSLTEVENVEDFGKAYRGMVVAEVTSVDKHPESNNLLVIKASDGKKTYKSVIQICDVKVGDRVVCIKPKMIVPGTGLQVSKTKIKGAISEVFVPSGRELGLNYDHSTVFKLDNNTMTGTKLSDVLDLEDQILEIKNKSLTHRPDTFGIYGLAREIVAIQGTKLKAIEWFENPNSIKPLNTSNDYGIEVRDQSDGLCKRYVAVVIRDVQVSDSPLWLQVELSKLGVHPVNNIVDISNYLMLLTGQPSHAFDYDQIVNNDPNFKKDVVLTVRTAKKNEKVVTLDGIKRELEKDMIVIADSVNAIAVAGVMGGKNTEISTKTKNIVYQVENLDMYSIRKTSMKLGLFSDAVTRFSKGIDPEMCLPVAYKAIEMMCNLAGGRVASKIIDIYPKRKNENIIKINVSDIISKTGIKIKRDEVVKILLRLGIRIIKKTDDFLEIKIPSFRPDLIISEDINEEIARIYGYDNVEVALPFRKCSPVADDEIRELILKIKNLLCSYGSHEMYTYSFVGKGIYDICDLTLDNCQKLINSISPELKYMRPLILPSLLTKIKQNYKNFGDFVCFEIDKVNPAEKMSNKLPEEPWHLGFLNTKSYYHAKRYFEELTKGLNIKGYKLEALASVPAKDLNNWIKYSRNIYNPMRSALIKIDQGYVGLIGEISKDVVEELSLPDSISGFELNLDELLPFVSNSVVYKPVSKYPGVVRDYCFVTDENVDYSEILNSIQIVDIGPEIVKEISCLDIFIDRNSNKKTTFRIQYQSMGRTLRVSDIEDYEKKMIKSVKVKTSGILAKV